jgi:hypothetical protein
MEHDAHRRANELLRSGTEAELQLLKRERKAERRLAEARAALAADQTRVARANKRMEKSLAAVAEAEAALRACQQQRALGPIPPDNPTDSA